MEIAGKHEQILERNRISVAAVLTQVAELVIIVRLRILIILQLRCCVGERKLHIVRRDDIVQLPFHTV